MMAPLASATFSSDLRDYIFVTRSKIDEWVEIEKAEVDKDFESHRQTVQAHQQQIDESTTQLLGMKMENGLDIKESAENCSKQKKEGFVNQKTTMKAEIETLEERLQNKANESDEVQCKVEEHKKALKEVKSRKSEADLARQATIDDLTRGIVNNKYLGLDFEKVDNDALRFIFTELDSKNPSKRFLFTIRANDEGDYYFTECSPPLDDSLKSELLNRFNAQEDMSQMVLDMRRAFTATL